MTIVKKTINFEQLRMRIEQMQTEKRRQEILDLLDGQRFAVFEDGRWGDPMSHMMTHDYEAESKQNWMRTLRETFADHHDRVRVCEFVQGWAGLDKDSRQQLVDENSNLFHPARANWLRNLSDTDCEILQLLPEPWQVYFHLSSDEPIVRVQLFQEAGMAAEGFDADLPSPAPSFAKAA